MVPCRYLAREFPARTTISRQSHLRFTLRIAELPRCGRLPEGHQVRESEGERETPPAEMSHRLDVRARGSVHSAEVHEAGCIIRSTRGTLVESDMSPLRVTPHRTSHAERLPLLELRTHLLRRLQCRNQHRVVFLAKSHDSTGHR
jgi:hypothetical protein